ncbi:DUF1450 domain-containing protein [Alicyclobacillus dauci]|uniref:DUF1450 domain-containing protein n=1 Tax=Alicyclobacillus dauci TaxID=1475485 RepID=UPI00389961E9
MRIEWCVHNERFGTRSVITDTVSAAAPDTSIRRFSCLEECDLCCRNPFVLIDNICISAPDAESLGAKISDEIAKRG